MSLFLAILFPAFVSAARLSESDFNWVRTFKEAGISEINVCGDTEILNTKKSLGKDFFAGTSLKGYAFSRLPSHSYYWQTLKSKNKELAREDLKKAFSKTTLWEVSKDGMTRSLGFLTNFEPRFTATVKDCVEGATKTISGNCNHLPPNKRASCCSEKFIGPEIQWKSGDKIFTLFYSPDPSVRLKVSDEKSHRYCQVVESIKLK